VRTTANIGSSLLSRIRFPRASVRFAGTPALGKASRLWQRANAVNRAKAIRSMLRQGNSSSQFRDDARQALANPPV